MKSILTNLFLVLLIELGIGTAFVFNHEKPLPASEPPDTLFTFIPPRLGTMEETLTYQDTPTSYPPSETFLNVEGDMILAHVNKAFALPPWYIPPGLVNLSGRLKTVGTEWAREVILPDLQALFANAEAACGCKLAVLSGYRSYQTQVITYGYWVSKVGQHAADRGSARPGHSEHQLGTTVDLTSSTIGYNLTRDFGSTCEGVWLERNAYLYGFSLSYHQGKEAITGYAWEPWHFRWVGKETAAEVKTAGVTLEEFLSQRQ